MPERTPTSGRLAAWIALVAVLALVASLVVLVFRNLGTLLLVLLAIAIAAACGWLALSRHGAVRVLALVVAIAALIGGAIALVARGAVDELVIVVIAAAVALISARSALRAGAEPQASVVPAPARPRPSADGSPRGPVLLMNPKSGGGKVEKFDLVNEAARRGIGTVLLNRGDDLWELARDAITSASVIGMAGGDGSQAIVAQVAMENDVPYVCVPAGTRNHLALDLGLDRDDVVGALDAFSSDVERRIDLAFVNDRIFVNNVSLGIYAEIVQSDAYRDAKLETMQSMLPDLLGPRATPFDLRFKGPDDELQESAQLVLVSNNPYVLDRIGAMGSRPRMDTGRLGIIAMEIKSAAEAAALVSLQAVGQAQLYRLLLRRTRPDQIADDDQARSQYRRGFAAMLAISGRSLLRPTPAQRAPPARRRPHAPVDTRSTPERHRP